MWSCLRPFTSNAHKAHLSAHLVDIQKNDSPVRCPCYSQMCSSTIEMSAVEVKKHLATEHQIPILHRLKIDFV
jgi:hypothetical protein